jgi:hypothetical protein
MYLKHLLGNVQTDRRKSHKCPSLLSDGAYLEVLHCRNRDGSMPLGQDGKDEKTAPTEASGSMMARGREGKMEILGYASQENQHGFSL